MFAAEVTFDQTQDVLVIIGAFFAAVGGFYYWCWRPFVRLDEERAQRIADKAASQAVEPLAATLATIKGEVTTNGGKSLKDVVLDTRERQMILEAKFDQHMQEKHT
jgi:hypothetical protein